MAKANAKAAEEKVLNYKNRVFKIEVTAIYNEATDVDTIADELSDELYAALKKGGRKLAIMNVESVKAAAKPAETALRIIDGISKNSRKEMDMGETKDGEKFVVVKNGEDEAPSAEKASAQRTEKPKKGKKGSRK